MSILNTTPDSLTRPVMLAEKLGSPNLLGPLYKYTIMEEGEAFLSKTRAKQFTEAFGMAMDRVLRSTFTFSLDDNGEPEYIGVVFPCRFNSTDIQRQRTVAGFSGGIYDTVREHLIFHGWKLPTMDMCGELTPPVFTNMCRKLCNWVEDEVRGPYINFSRVFSPGGVENVYTEVAGVDGFSDPDIWLGDCKTIPVEIGFATVQASLTAASWATRNRLANSLKGMAGITPTIDDSIPHFTTTVARITKPDSTIAHKDNVIKRVCMLVKKITNDIKY